VSLDVDEADGDHGYVLYGRLDCSIYVIVICGCCLHMYRVHLEEFVNAVEDALIVAVYGECWLGLVCVGVLG